MKTDPPQPNRDVSIRCYVESDHDKVYALIQQAFDRSDEARLVDDLRYCGMMVLERVACLQDGTIVGHVAYSRMTGTCDGLGLKVCTLAPVSVAPKHQNTGIGAALIEATMDTLQGMGEDVVLVLGMPEYYCRFGFDSELAKKFVGPYSGPVYMANGLTHAGRSSPVCEVSYATPFQALS
ncbi:GNAT family N-acetyltransferase [Polycladidibacter stylochi]|uniref:GNAT family N-acetyltransferase n=1 Tax=Polycladidibacter stylochi TaxID=1807766 RepID=UPI00083438F3|nr:N-acetyltransferase [Pseudovibrio stylochi]